MRRKLYHVVGKDKPGTMRDEITGRSFAPDEVDYFDEPGEPRGFVRVRGESLEFACSPLAWQMWCNAYETYHAQLEAEADLAREDAFLGDS